MKILVADRVSVYRRSDRQKHVEPSALSNFAIDMDKAAVAGHNVVNGRQAEPRTVAAFGSEKRFEEARLRRKVHSASVIPHCEQGAGKERGAARDASIRKDLHFAVA